MEAQADQHIATQPESVTRSTFRGRTAGVLAMLAALIVASVIGVGIASVLGHSGDVATVSPQVTANTRESRTAIVPNARNPLPTLCHGTGRPRI